MFGRGSPELKTLPKLPAKLFQNFEVNGSLKIILSIALKTQIQNNWESFDLSPLERSRIAIEMLKNIECKLLEGNHFSYPKVFFSPKLDLKLIEELAVIVVSHRGTVVSDQSEASHKVEWSEEIDTLPSELQEEYVRPLDMRPISSMVSGEGQALVHWWYYPDSYDEWINSGDLEGSEPPDTVSEPSPSHVWTVACRFVRDCEVFNEWGNEYDYEAEGESEGEKEDKVQNQTSKSSRRSRPNRRELTRRDDPVQGSVQGLEKMLSHHPSPSLDPNRQCLTVVQISPNPNPGSPSLPQVVQVVNGSGEKRHLPPSPSSTSPSLKRPCPPPSQPLIPSSISPFEHTHLSDILGSPEEEREYLRVRDLLLSLDSLYPSQYLSSTDCRKKVAGDVCLVLRIHQFLDAFSFINQTVREENRPPVNTFLPFSTSSHTQSSSPASSGWSDLWDGSLLAAVLAAGSGSEVDWVRVSQNVSETLLNQGLCEVGSLSSVSPQTCMARFSTLPLSQCSPVSLQPRNWLQEGQELSSLALSELGLPRARQLVRGALSSLPHGESRDREGVLALGLAGAAEGARRGEVEREERVNELTSLYVRNRLETLEEKSRLLDSVQGVLEAEKERQIGERRDLAVQRAVLASLPLQTPSK